MTERGKRTGRAEWQKRVARWRDSGLSADEFAAEIGVNAGTLRQWKYTLNRDARGGAKCREATADVPRFVEVARLPSASANMFQLELDAGRRLHIPSDFDSDALQRLLSLLVRS